MIILFLTATPLIGLLLTCTKVNYKINRIEKRVEGVESTEKQDNETESEDRVYVKEEIEKGRIKYIAIISSTLSLLGSVSMYTLFDLSSNQFQFVKEYYELSAFNIYLGVDGVSIYFIILTTIIMPISLISN